MVPPNLLHEFTQQDQTSRAQQVVNGLNILKPTLDAYKDVGPVGIFQTMVLQRDTGALFGLILFKAGFVDYTEY